ncbi:hypothetical protein OZX73_00070 [Bifidobacterium sp. ESL0775]|uniref:leucine-rich repeat domain-containing protein n=1 Tax=Bifidobacterium sp. ESL0775 TaxID=2983230 RepID=UPI0023F939BF|nr:leucine-rich repeat domain-containing protein [Bifidobacterium sp. ESL0775]WEV69341.1 hypothetical protein OZX73_00070 [Bifidobacterium sp. ESL0775]
MTKKRYSLAASFAAACMVVSGIGVGVANASEALVATQDESSCVVGTSTIAQCFPDQNLAKAVASTISSTSESVKPNNIFTQNMIDSMAGKNSNFLLPQKVSDWEGVQYLTKLGSIQAECQGSSLGKNFSLIGHLKGLHALYISNRGEGTCSVADPHRNERLSSADAHEVIDVASQLPNLAGFGISGSEFSDLNGIEKLPNLTNLDLSDDSLTDVEKLAKFVDLDELYLDGNKLTNVDALASLHKLSDLWLNRNHITNVDKLAKLTNLDELYLDGNELTNVDALAALSEITNLTLASNRLTNVDALNQLTKLNSFSVAGNQISDISHLRGIINQKLYENGYGNGDIDKQPAGGQRITLNPVRIGSSVSVKTAVGLDGKYIQPSSVSPANGTYDASAGVVTWNSLTAPGTVSLTFTQKLSLNWDTSFSGTISQPYTIDSTGDENSPTVSGGSSKPVDSTSGATASVSVPVAPTFASLSASNKGSVSAPASAVAGSDVRMNIGNLGDSGKAAVDAGRPYYVYAYIYSDPVALTSDGQSHALLVKKDANGYFVTVRIPAGYSGAHTIAVLDANGRLVGWSPVTVVAARVKDSGSSLAKTGSSVAVVALVAVMSLTLAAGALLVRRRE